MVRFRRHPTNKATSGVCLFNIYSLHLTYNSTRNSGVTVPVLLLLAASVLLSAFFLFVKPILQSQSYHNFADKRMFLCLCHGASEGLFLPLDTQRGNRNNKRGFIIPNFGDVLSNLVIFAGRFFGLVLLYMSSSNNKAEPLQKWQM